jgi:hypothetical protein
MKGPHTPGNEPIQAPDFGDDVLPPINGHCLCGDFSITVVNPRPGIIMCHCFDCQVNSASFFGTYISAGMSRVHPILVESADFKI